MNLTYQGASQISKIEFASFGNPEGTCQAFKKGNSESPNALDKITEVIFILNSEFFLFCDQYIIRFLLFSRNVLDRYRARLLQMRPCSVSAVNAEMLSRNSWCNQSVVSASGVIDVVTFRSPKYAGAEMRRESAT